MTEAEVRILRPPAQRRLGHQKLGQGVRKEAPL